MLLYVTMAGIDPSDCMVTYRELFDAFFPLTFFEIPVVLPAPRWDDDTGGEWIRGEPTETMTDLDATSEELFAPMPEYD